jgi:hypothetical protein
MRTCLEAGAETLRAPGLRACPHCGKLGPFFADFCTQCGAKLPG